MNLYGRLTQGAQGVLADLSQVHYPALDLPACMLKYAPLTLEQLQRESEQAVQRHREHLQRLIAECQKQRTDEQDAPQ